MKVSGHVQQSVLLALLDLGVTGVHGLAQHANTTTASIFTAAASLVDDGLIAIAPQELHEEDSRKGARQYGLTAVGIDVAIELEEWMD